MPYANLTKGFGITYWKIGNVNYGNGFYGAAWEMDNHTDKSPIGYATVSLDFIAKMRAKDPSITVGVLATVPGHWPDLKV